ncbi:MAG: grasp-with-spasm system SPASM domain peptide maturase [Bacteroidota bacterium]
MLPQNLPIKLYANCLPVKGKRRSIICDLQRDKITLIPNDLFDILNDYKNQTLASIKAAFDLEDGPTIESYFAFLYEQEYIFFTPTPELFPDLDMYWDDPTMINHAILDWNASSDYNWQKAIRELDELGCGHLQIRFYQAIEWAFLNTYLQYIAQSEASIIGIEIILAYTPDCTVEALVQLTKQFPRINSLIIHTAPEERYFPPVQETLGHIQFVTKNLDSARHCGQISPRFFSINIRSFTEAQSFNSCLNRKIAVDVDGWIKNCPSMSTSFGHIDQSSLTEALSKSDFKALWSITKDQISTCKNCEFRYICTDCRAFREHPNDLLVSGE